MRLSIKLIEEVVAEVAGEDVIELVRILKDKKNVSEFKLAESIKMEVNRVRNMLYRLHDANLVSFVRKKDKKKGWYIYYWTFNPNRIKDLAISLKTKRLGKLKERLEREEANQFYACTTNHCIRLDFDQAMNFEFKCPECGDLIDQEDNAEYIEKIKAEMKEIEEELKEGNSKPKPKKSPSVKKKTVKNKSSKKKVAKKKSPTKKKKVVKKKTVKNKSSKKKVAKKKSKKRKKSK